MSEILKDSPYLFHQFINYLPSDYYIDENLKKNIQFHTQLYDKDELSTEITGADLNKINQLFNFSKKSLEIKFDNNQPASEIDNENEEEYSEMSLAYSNYIFKNTKGRKRNFSEFINNQNSITTHNNNTSVDKPDNNNQKRIKIVNKDLGFFLHCKGELSETSFHELLNCFEDYTNGIISLYDFDFLITNILSINEILLLEYNKIFKNRFQLNKLGIEPFEYQPSVLIEGLEIISKTPSYIQLPNNFPYQYSSYCNEQSNVLNYKYISVPTTSAYRSSYKNKYEQILATYEDYKYEIDIMIECLRSTINKLEEVKNYKNNNEILQSLSDIHYKTISRLYNENGNNILQLFKIQPIQCIPVFLKELNDSLKKWLDDREAFDISFSRQYKTNYLRAYDHFSTKFIVQDKRLFIKKVDLQDIYDLKEKDEKCECISKDSFSLLFPIDSTFRNDIYNLVILSLQTSPYKSKLNGYINFYSNIINYLFNENLINHKIIIGNIIKTNIGKGIIKSYNPLTHIIEIDYIYCFSFTHINDLLPYSIYHIYISYSF